MNPVTAALLGGSTGATARRGALGGRGSDRPATKGIAESSRGQITADVWRSRGFIPLVVLSSWPWRPFQEEQLVRLEQEAEPFVSATTACSQVRN
jgi:hypothetical protein